VPIEIADGAFSLPGLKVGHADDPIGLTGLTVMIFEAGARAACDVRGGAPGTRESAALDPLSLVPVIHGLLFTGGSAFGLEAAAGVMRWLEERGIGFRTPDALVPIVPAAVIYDLRLGGGRVRPDAAMAYRAAAEAGAGPFAEGSVGAGRGATVGKVRGREGMMRGGIGAASARTAGGYTVGALAVVNAFGDVVDPASGRIVAGTRGENGRFLDSAALLAAGAAARRLAQEGAPDPGGHEGPPEAFEGSRENTTLVAILTDAPLSRVALGRVARMAHDGLARAIRPAHTPFDGDVVYAVSTAAGEADGPAAIAAGVAGAEVAARAIVRGVLYAEAHADAPAASR
jgi:L-aminopeptidase/D-esterase-like protein